MSFAHPATFSRNRLLATIPKEHFHALQSRSERVQLVRDQVLDQPDAQARFVYFPEPSLVSVLAYAGSGDRGDMGLFGPEGMSGLAALHGQTRAAWYSVVQVPGPSIRILASDFSDLLAKYPQIRDHLLRYSYSFAVQLAHTALVNATYDLTARLARWLLMCGDRVEGPAVRLTQSTLAVMLSVRRASVTTALQSFESKGAIASARGQIEIRDRQQLQAFARGSYGSAETEYLRVFDENSPA